MKTAVLAESKLGYAILSLCLKNKPFVLVRQKQQSRQQSLGSRQIIGTANGIEEDRLFSQLFKSKQHFLHFIKCPGLFFWSPNGQLKYITYIFLIS